MNLGLLRRSDLSSALSPYHPLSHHCSSVLEVVCSSAVKLVCVHYLNSLSDSLHLKDVDLYIQVAVATDPEHLTLHVEFHLA